MEDRQIHVTTLEGRLPVNIVHVYEPHQCAHCRMIVDAHAVCLGEPYHAVLHQRCMPHFDYTNQWPHQEASITYMTLEAQHSGASSRRSSISIASGEQQHFSNAIAIPQQIPGSASGAPGSSFGSGAGSVGSEGARWPGGAAALAPR